MSTFRLVIFSEKNRTLLARNTANLSLTTLRTVPLYP